MGTITTPRIPQDRVELVHARKGQQREHGDHAAGDDPAQLLALDAPGGPESQDHAQ
jgi:hypothetical protein